MNDKVETPPPQSVLISINITEAKEKMKPSEKRTKAES